MVSPKKLDEDQIRVLTEHIPPDCLYHVQVGLRITTQEGLKVLFQKAEVQAEARMKGHVMVITATGSNPLIEEEDSPFWEGLVALLKNDPYIEGWKVLLNDKVVREYDKAISDMLAKQTRPVNDRGITNEHILDLRISLETCQDVNDFINSI